MDNTDANTWKKCSSCKKPIKLGAKYYVCSVSTCTNQRTGYVFCGVSCFETHLPGARHRDAAAIEMRAPANAAAAAAAAADGAAEGTAVGTRRIVTPPNQQPGSTASQPARPGQLPQEVLVIASRLKDYIFARSEYNTSASVMDVLSQHLRILCDRAIDNARAEGRKTVMDRDFQFLKNLK
jgi:D-serine deaminase-like pyridoxal phosphate-dependent protein